jgi:hypothetical protein
MKSSLIGAAVIAALAMPVAGFAVTSYQVTGQVLEVSDTAIVVEKGREKFDIAREADTKVDGGDLKVGEKVTVFYTMSAKKVEVKAGKKVGLAEKTVDKTEAVAGKAGKVAEKTVDTTAKVVDEAAASTGKAVKGAGKAVKSTTSEILGKKP